MSRDKGKKRMFKDLEEKFKNRFANQPEISEKFQEKRKLIKLSRPSRGKVHNKIPKRLQHKENKQ